MLGSIDPIACAAIRGLDGVVLTKEALEQNGMDVQLFVDCSLPGETIIFATEAVEPRDTIVVKHPVVFDVVDPNATRVAIKCPISGTIFDIQ